MTQGIDETVEGVIDVRDGARPASPQGSFLRSGEVFGPWKLLDHVATNIIHLRPALFFENYLGSLQSIKDDGKIYMPVSGSRKIPMIATRDIVRLAFDRLVDTSWTGRSVRGLHGPCDLSFDDAAKCISSGLERNVDHVMVNDETARGAMMKAGMSESVCELMLEMFRGYEHGTLRADEERSPETYTPTKLAEFAKGVIRPLVEEGVVH